MHPSDCSLIGSLLSSRWSRTRFIFLLLRSVNSTDCTCPDQYGSIQSNTSPIITGCQIISGVYHKETINSSFSLIDRYDQVLFCLMKITFSQLWLLHLHPNVLFLFAIVSYMACIFSSLVMLLKIKVKSLIIAPHRLRQDARGVAFYDPLGSDINVGNIRDLLDKNL